MIAPGDVRRAALIADNAMGKAWADYAVGNAASEDRVTERLATRLQDEMAAFVSQHGNTFQIRPFQASAGRDRKSEETEFGADFVVALTVNTLQQQQCSGWIGQAKIADKAAWSDLKSQCAQMDEVLPGLGWGVLFARNTTVIPAKEIASLTAPRHAKSLRRTSWRPHFEAFFSGRVGDWRACELLRTGFVEARQRQYAAVELLAPRATILDMFYGTQDRVVEWAASRSDRLRGVQARASEPNSDERSEEQK